MTRFALLVPESDLVTEFGDFFLGKCGICRVDGDYAEAMIVPQHSLAKFVDGYPCTPHLEIADQAFPSLDEEIECCRLIREEARQAMVISKSGTPPLFRKMAASEIGGLTVSVHHGAITLIIGGSLSRRMLARNGDRISLSVSNDRCELCLHFDPEGRVLTSSGMLDDELTVTLPFDVSAIDVELPTQFDGRPPFQFRDGRVFFLARDLVNFVPLAPGIEEVSSGDEDDAVEALLSDIDLEPIAFQSAQPGRWATLITWMHYLAQISPIR